MLVQIKAQLFTVGMWIVWFVVEPCQKENKVILSHLIYTFPSPHCALLVWLAG